MRVVLGSGSYSQGQILAAATLVTATISYQISRKSNPGTRTRNFQIYLVKVKLVETYKRAVEGHLEVYYHKETRFSTRLQLVLNLESRHELRIQRCRMLARVTGSDVILGKVHRLGLA